LTPSSWGQVGLGSGQVKSVKSGSGQVESGQVESGSSQVESGQVESGSSQVEVKWGGGPVRSSQVGSVPVGVGSGPVRVQSGRIRGLVVEFGAHNLLRWTRGRIDDGNKEG